jgi:hypothetical protein
VSAGMATVLRADARSVPLPDASVDLIVTSPPYFALRSYTDGGEHYAGQIGAEPTPQEYIASLIECTREWMRVLKPGGSIWVNLGDSYSGKPSSDGTRRRDKAGARGERPSRHPLGRDMTREEAAWLAGVIDSDGSVSIHINKQPEGRAPSFVPWVRIGQMRPEVVQHAAKVTGIGQVMQDGRGVWNWCASAQQARWVLSRIYPWLLIKRRQAAAAIEVARHIEERNGRGEYRPLTDEDVAYRQRLRLAAMTWNAGQEDDLAPPEPAPIALSHYPLPAGEKSLMALPELYRIACIYELGLIARAVVIWSKANPMPESVTDRVRRSHEDWVHLTKASRYFSAVDEIREPHTDMSAHALSRRTRTDARLTMASAGMTSAVNPLGKLPGSVWEIATEPLKVPDHLGIDHFAAFPTEWPRRIISGWSPSGICVACGEGRRPVTVTTGETSAQRNARLGALDVAVVPGRETRSRPGQSLAHKGGHNHVQSYQVTGYSCDCPEPTAPTRPAVVLDPFGGTGTAALVAKVLGRHGISVDRSADYCRLARWRTTDPGQIAKAMRVPAPVKQLAGQEDLFAALEEVA